MNFSRHSVTLFHSGTRLPRDARLPALPRPQRRSIPPIPPKSSVPTQLPFCKNRPVLTPSKSTLPQVFIPLDFISFRRNTYKKTGGGYPSSSPKVSQLVTTHTRTNSTRRCVRIPILFRQFRTLSVTHRGACLPQPSSSTLNSCVCASFAFRVSYFAPFSPLVTHHSPLLFQPGAPQFRKQSLRRDSQLLRC